MRDPERIDRMIEHLRQLWHAHPDQRLGQLLCNVLQGDLEPWLVEDDATERKLRWALIGGLGAARETI
jgi:hypothetical protein